MSLMMETEQGTEFFSEEDDLFLESSLDHAEDSLPDQGNTYCHNNTSVIRSL